MLRIGKWLSWTLFAVVAMGALPFDGNAEGVAPKLKCETHDDGCWYKLILTAARAGRGVVSGKEAEMLSMLIDEEMCAVRPSFDPEKVQRLPRVEMWQALQEHAERSVTESDLLLYAAEAGWKEAQISEDDATAALTWMHAYRCKTATTLEGIREQLRRAQEKPQLPST